MPEGSRSVENVPPRRDLCHPVRPRPRYVVPGVIIFSLGAAITLILANIGGSPLESPESAFQAMTAAGFTCLPTPKSALNDSPFGHGLTCTLPPDVQVSIDFVRRRARPEQLQELSDEQSRICSDSDPDDGASLFGLHEAVWVNVVSQQSSRRELYGVSPESVEHVSRVLGIRLRSC